MLTPSRIENTARGLNSMFVVSPASSPRHSASSTPLSLRRPPSPLLQVSPLLSQSTQSQLPTPLELEGSLLSYAVPSSTDDDEVLTASGPPPHMLAAAAAATSEGSRSVTPAPSSPLQMHRGLRTPSLESPVHNQPPPPHGHYRRRATAEVARSLAKSFETQPVVSSSSAAAAELAASALVSMHADKHLPAPGAPSAEPTPPQTPQTDLSQDDREKRAEVGAKRPRATALAEVRPRKCSRTESKKMACDDLFVPLDKSEAPRRSRIEAAEKLKRMNETHKDTQKGDSAVATGAKVPSASASGSSGATSMVTRSSHARERTGGSAGALAIASVKPTSASASGGGALAAAKKKASVVVIDEDDEKGPAALSGIALGAFDRKRHYRHQFQYVGPIQCADAVAIEAVGAVERDFNLVYDQFNKSVLPADTSNLLTLIRQVGVCTSRPFRDTEVRWTEQTFREFFHLLVAESTVNVSITKSASQCYQHFLSAHSGEKCSLRMLCAPGGTKKLVRSFLPASSTPDRTRLTLWQAFVFDVLLAAYRSADCEFRGAADYDYKLEQCVAFFEPLEGKAPPKPPTFDQCFPLLLSRHSVRYLYEILGFKPPIEWLQALVQTRCFTPVLACVAGINYGQDALRLVHHLPLSEETHHLWASDPSVSYDDIGEFVMGVFHAFPHYPIYIGFLADYVLIDKSLPYRQWVFANSHRVTFVSHALEAPTGRLECIRSNASRTAQRLLATHCRDVCVQVNLATTMDATVMPIVSALVSAFLGCRF